MIFGGIGSSIARAGAAISELLLLKRKRAPADEARAIRKAAKQADRDAREAVARHDEEAVNRILREAEDKRGDCMIAACVALATVSVFALLLLAGCVRVRERVVEVPSNTAVRFMEVDGEPGWWVPDVTMGRLVGSAAAAAELEALRDVWEAERAAR